MSDIKYDMDFEEMLIESMPEMPPADISHTVTPWRKAMNMILWGMGLTTVTFNFLLLQYILPTIGILLMVMGFQMLRSENKWFKASFIVSILQLVTIIIVLISNTIAVAELTILWSFYPLSTWQSTLPNTFASGVLWWL